MIKNSIFVILVFTIGTILLSSISIPFSSGQNQVDLGFDWTYPAYDKHATNFSPQNQITRDSIHLLVDDWTTAFVIPSLIPGIVLNPGVSGKPLGLDGILYVTTNFLDVFVHRAETGNGLWFYAYPINMTQVVVDNPAISPFDSGRVFGSTIFEGNLIMPTPDCGIVLLDAMVGTPQFRGELTRAQMCTNVDGNDGFYTGQMLYSPVIYESGRVLITATGVSGKVESGRGFIAGFDVDTGKLLWRFFLMPPAGGDPDWTMQYSGRGNVEPVMGDWGDVRGVGVGAGWGQWAIDEETGTVYVGTSAPSPYFNATHRPGPNLFSSSILAIDAMTGDLKWYYQVSPHDLYGFGCASNTTLGMIGDRKVVFKLCDNGRLYALDAATGELIWSTLAPDIKYLNVEDPFIDRPNLDKRWANEPSIEQHWQCPGISGASGGEIAFAYNRIYYITTNYCDYINHTAVEPGMLTSSGAEFPYGTDFNEAEFEMPKNSTVYAVDASTGNVEWTFDIPTVSHTGGLIVSGNLVFFASLNGKLYALDTDTGQNMYIKDFGALAAMGVPPTIAAGASGEQYLYQVIGGVSDRFTQPVSGLIVSMKIRGGPVVDIGMPPVDREPPQPDRSPGEIPQIPLTIVLPALAVIVAVFMLAAFGKKVNLGGKKGKNTS